MRNKKTKKMVLFSMLLAIEVILSFTPLGFLRITGNSRSAWWLT